MASYQNAVASASILITLCQMAPCTNNEIPQLKLVEGAYVGGNKVTHFYPGLFKGDGHFVGAAACVPVFADSVEVLVQAYLQNDDVVVPISNSTLLSFNPVLFLSHTGQVF